MPNVSWIAIALIVVALLVRHYFHPLRRDALVWGAPFVKSKFIRTWRLHWAIVQACDWAVAGLVAYLCVILFG